MSLRSARALVGTLTALAARTASAHHGAGATGHWSLEVWLLVAGAVAVLLMVAWAWLAPEREERGERGPDARAAGPSRPADPDERGRGGGGTR